MRIAIISDIHGNMEALRAVLADIDASGVDTLINLGDIIGYGPEPEPAIDLLQKRNIPSVLGNHELAVKDRYYINNFNPNAKKSILTTIEMLSKSSLKLVSALPTSLVKFGCRFVHGFPPDSPIIYLHQMLFKSLAPTFHSLEEKMCFIGHTHELHVIDFDGHTENHNRLAQGILNLDKNKQYIINTGSVGQPRDGDNNAKYVIFDTVSFELDVKFIPYDIDSVVKKIIDAGLPRANAMRLL